MAEEMRRQTALGDVAARQLAFATRTVPQMITITPRCLTQRMNWIPVESGVLSLYNTCGGSMRSSRRFNACRREVKRPAATTK